MTLTNREKYILFATIAIAVGTVLYLQGIEPLYTTYLERQALLEKEQTQFKNNVQLLQEAKAIEEGYRRIEAQFPKEEPGKDP
jgi:type II secretory pathway component PulM